MNRHSGRKTGLEFRRRPREVDHGQLRLVNVGEVEHGGLEALVNSRIAVDGMLGAQEVTLPIGFAPGEKNDRKYKQIITNNTE